MPLYKTVKTMPTGVIVGDTDTQTLTNKTINGSQLVNDSVTPAKAGDLGKFINYQKLTTDTTVTDQLIQYGWDYVNGDGTNVFASKTVTFATAYDAYPVVIIGQVGALATTPITEINELTVAANCYTRANSITTTNFVANVSRVSQDGNATSALATTACYSFSWIAIGTKAR